VKGEGHVQKWHLRYKTSDIGDKSGDLGSTFGLLFQGAKFFHNGYLAYFLSERDDIWLR